jgi:hypothetical protein
VSGPDISSLLGCVIVKIEEDELVKSMDLKISGESFEKASVKRIIKKLNLEE